MQLDRNKPTRGLKGVSQSTFRFVLPVLASLGLMWIAAVISLELLSTIRAYVGGEGLYSKGQKNATYYLAQYAQSRSEDDFGHYEAAIAFPLGDWQARLALQRRPVDLKAAREGFVQGGNNPADVDSIILMFRLFGNFGPVRKAIDIWAEGDGYTLQLRAVAARLHASDPAKLSAQEQAQIRAELNRINRELTPLGERFSATLSELARTTRTLLVLFLAGATLTTGFLCIRVTRARIAERLAKERRLARVTELYAALTRASQLISRVSDRGHLFDEICKICVSTSGLSLAAVGLIRPDRTSVEFVAAHGEHREHLAHLESISTTRGSANRDGLHSPLHTGRSTVLDLVDAVNGGFLSQSSFPLVCREEVVGILCVFSAEMQYFQADILELMDQLAMEVSLALDSLHREAERRDQAAMLTDQNRILNLIAAGADLEVTFLNLIQFVEEQVQGASVSLAALQGEAGRYGLVVAPSLPRGFCRAVVEASGVVGGEPSGQVTAERTPIVIPDLTGSTMSESLRGHLGKGNFKGLRAWPILGRRGAVLGVLSLYHTTDDLPPLNPQLIHICTNLAGIAIESRRAANRISHLAHHDDLTGLPNRLLFNQLLPQALARAQRTGRSVAVFFLDLDRFKVINDTLGHAAGDDVLRQVTRHLLACVRASDILARVGGDEFTLLVKHFTGPEELVAVAQRLLAAIAHPLRVNCQEYQLSASIGIAIYPQNAADGSSLLKNADIAMYRAKAAGKNTYHVYSHETDAQSLERLSLEHDLRQAVARREFEVYYQPKIDIRSGCIVGAEALVRWQHPNRGLILPGEFILVAEELGLISSLGSIVLETVCTDIVRWNQEGVLWPRVAINLSAQQFADARLLESLDEVLHATHCDPGSLEFEITETVMMTNPDKALHLLKNIRRYGITFAIDDFGTGHSSFAYLKRFAVDRVKIDNTFVRDIATQKDDLAITRAIVGLGHSLGLQVVAEGVESETQLHLLRNMRCDEYQGFLFSRAVPGEQFARMLSARPHERVQEPGQLSLLTAR